MRIDQVADANFAFFHSATFNNDGSKVIFTDEWGGGTRPRCRAADNPAWGADTVFEIVDRKLKFAGYYKLPAPQSALENCVAHDGSIIPVPGRDIMVQGWIGRCVGLRLHRPGQARGDRLLRSRAHRRLTARDGRVLVRVWNNGYIYASEISRGIDVFRLTPSAFLSKDELEAAALVHTDELNVQQQTRIAWPARAVVARA